MVVGHPLKEAQVAARARRGDERAFEELLRRHETIAFRTAYLITGSAADAEDVVQEACLKAYRALGRFDPSRPFRPWLLAIVANEARNRLRGDARRADLALRAAREGRPDDAAPPAEASLLAGERRATLLAALDRLRDEERLAVACRYLLDLSEEETAAALGVARGTVKSRVSRALDRLRAELETPDA